MVGQYLKIWRGSLVVGYVGRGSRFLIFGWVDVGRRSCVDWVVCRLGRGSRGSWVNFRDPLPSLASTLSLQRELPTLP